MKAERWEEGIFLPPFFCLLPFQQFSRADIGTPWKNRKTYGRFLSIIFW
jgi:hypothetical protein